MAVQVNVAEQEPRPAADSCLVSALAVALAVSEIRPSSTKGKTVRSSPRLQPTSSGSAGA
jgi:hypothetical protein